MCNEKEALWGKGHIQSQWDSKICPSGSPSASKASQPQTQALGMNWRGVGQAAARLPAAAGGRPGPCLGAALHWEACFDEKALHWWFLHQPQLNPSRGCCSQRLLS